MTGSSKPRIPRPGTAAFSFLNHYGDQEEVNIMTLNVLDALAAGDLQQVETLPCRLNDPELFFAEQPADVELAKSLCQTCPVRAECLAGALERREPWGVWGGQLIVSGAI